MYVATLSRGWMSQEGAELPTGSITRIAVGLMAHSSLLYLHFEDSKQRMPVSQWEEGSMNRMALEM